MLRKMDPIDFAEQSGATVVTLDVKDRLLVMQQWREAYARAVKERTGSWVYEGHDWHTFSWNFCRYRQGARALSEYLSERVIGVYVIPEDEEQSAFICNGPRLLDFSDCRADVHVFPENLSWTAAFTHEQPDIGPYFSRFEWVTQGAG
jgi:hypothetical protein